MLAHRGSSDCWSFLSNTTNTQGSLLWNIKHLKATVTVKWCFINETEFNTMKPGVYHQKNIICAKDSYFMCPFVALKTLMCSSTVL